MDWAERKKGKRKAESHSNFLFPFVFTTNLLPYSRQILCSSSGLPSSGLRSPFLGAVEFAVFGVDAFVGNHVGRGYAGDHQGHNNYNPDHRGIAVGMNGLESIEPGPKTTSFSQKYQKRRAGRDHPVGPAGGKRCSYLFAAR